MAENVITLEKVRDFEKHLVVEEKSATTVEKYVRDAKRFILFLDGRPVTKELVIVFKRNLIESSLTVRSINSMLASVNSLLCFVGLEECKVKNI